MLPAPLAAGTVPTAGPRYSCARWSKRVGAAIEGAQDSIWRAERCGVGWEQSLPAFLEASQDTGPGRTDGQVVIHGSLPLPPTRVLSVWTLEGESEKHLAYYRLIRGRAVESGDLPEIRDYLGPVCHQSIFEVYIEYFGF